MATITEPTKSKRPLAVLQDRTQDYVPLTPVHLHFDAIEVAALGEDLLEVPWSWCKALCAGHIQQSLHHRWGPRTGTMYEPPIRLDSTPAAAEDPGPPRPSSTWARAVSEIQALRDRTPDWNEVDIRSSVAADDVHELLFYLSRDACYLSEERFQHWALDLATAALAMYASAWTSRYSTFGAKITEEQRYWRALCTLFWLPISDQELSTAAEAPLTNEIPNELELSLIDVMSMGPEEWPVESLNLLAKAGRWYRNFLRSHGVDPSRVFDLLTQCEDTQPLRYTDKRS